jgi:hypothetical protein
MINCGVVMLASMAALLLFAGAAQSEEKEPSAIVEIGGAGEWSLQGGGSSFGPTIAVEVTPIEHWLEIEAGVMSHFGSGRTEWDTDLLFKNPFTLSKTVEFMFGAGPEWVHTTSGGTSADSIAGEAVLDFMLWPWPERKFGWYLEPSYSYDFGKGHEKSLGVSVGLLIAIP